VQTDNLVLFLEREIRAGCVRSDLNQIATYLQMIEDRFARSYDPPFERAQLLDHRDLLKGWLESAGAVPLPA
jgi:hypothetical protein